jgi:hypothetical protein
MVKKLADVVSNSAFQSKEFILEIGEYVHQNTACF